MMMMKEEEKKKKGQEKGGESLITKHINIATWNWTVDHSKLKTIKRHNSGPLNSQSPSTRKSQRSFKTGRF